MSTEGELVDGLRTLGLPERAARQQAEYLAKQMAYAEEIVAADPRIPFMSAVSMGGDRAGREQWTRTMIEEGKPPTEIANLIGSYERMGFALDHCPTDWLFEHLPDLWRGSDPDDTDVRFLTMWRQAFEWNGGPLIDGDPLPARKVLVVYRGQWVEDPLGLAWSLSGATAHKFARGAGLRTDAMGGAVLRGTVRRSDVLGYLTRRGESEIVVNPLLVRDVRVLGGYGSGPSGAGESRSTPARPDGAPRAS